MTGEEKLEKLLDEFESSLNFCKNTAPETELQELITIAENAERLSADDCLELCVKFNSYALFIKRVQNREIAKRNTYASAINKLVSSRWNDYGNVYGNDIKINMIANEYEMVREYLELKNQAQRNIDQIDGISNTVDKYINIMQQYARKKDV